MATKLGYLKDMAQEVRTVSTLTDLNTLKRIAKDNNMDTVHYWWTESMVNNHVVPENALRILKG